MHLACCTAVAKLLLLFGGYFCLDVQLAPQGGTVSLLLGDEYEEPDLLAGEDNDPDLFAGEGGKPDMTCLLSKVLSFTCLLEQMMSLTCLLDKMTNLTSLLEKGDEHDLPASLEKMMSLTCWLEREETDLLAREGDKSDLLAGEDDLLAAVGEEPAEGEDNQEKTRGGQDCFRP
jgi:hypothetical protein